MHTIHTYIYEYIPYEYIPSILYEIVCKRTAIRFTFVRENVSILSGRMQRGGSRVHM